MKKFVCKVCGYIYEGEAAPEKCPQCKAPATKFEEQKGDMENELIDVLPMLFSPVK